MNAIASIVFALYKIKQRNFFWTPAVYFIKILITQHFWKSSLFFMDFSLMNNRTFSIYYYIAKVLNNAVQKVYYKKSEMKTLEV